MFPLAEAFNVGDISSWYPMLPAAGLAPAQKPAVNNRPPGFLPPPPSAPASVGAVPSGVKIRACCVSQGLRQSSAFRRLAAGGADSDIGPGSGTNPACASSAALSLRGSSLPRSHARRKMPRQAFLVK